MLPPWGLIEVKFNSTSLDSIYMVLLLDIMKAFPSLIFEGIIQLLNILVVKVLSSASDGLFDYVILNRILVLIWLKLLNISKNI
jgi:hypothetical protein